MVRRVVARRRRMMSRCQRRIVSGVTSSSNPWRRAFCITPSSAASRARSAQFSFGRRGRRCRTASWWRRIKISAVFHVSSRRESHSHAASRVIRRKTNRRHMIGDHHGRSAGRATLLVRAEDEILGTHRNVRPSRTPHAGHHPRKSRGSCRAVHRAGHCTGNRQGRSVWWEHCSPRTRGRWGHTIWWAAWESAGWARCSWAAQPGAD
jgi:hypothetical protein